MSQIFDCVNPKYEDLLKQELKKFPNGHVLQDPNETIYPIDGMVVRVGKKKFVKIKTSSKFY